jgi:hypothetical protein
VTDYQWAVGLVGGIVASNLGAFVRHALEGRAEARKRRFEVLRARYDAGSRAFSVYLGQLESPYEDLNEGEIYALTNALEEPFGARFADEAIGDFFDKTATKERFDSRKKAMRDQLLRWEDELGFPKREDLAGK